MKKLILFIALSMSITTVYSQVDTTTAQSAEIAIAAIPDSAQSTFNKVYDDVKQGLAGLAESLKVGSEYVWAVLVKQQMVISLIYLCMILFSIVSGTIFFNQISKCRTDWSEWRKTHSSYDCYFSSYILTSIVSGVVTCILFGIGIGNMDVILTGLINPEYGTIKDIISFIQ